MTFRTLAVGHLFLLFVSLLHAQSMRGVVISVTDSLPVAEANVYFEHSEQGVTTDSSGYFILKTGGYADNAVLIIHHIAYNVLRLPLKQARLQKVFILTPAVRTLNRIVVRETRAQTLLRHDLSASVTVLNASVFEGRGYVDVGDLLHAEPGVQVHEDISGRKTLSLRGGNPEDVTVFYNGVKLNSLYDNIFDLSLINVEDIRRLEIIRGSNTALYGSEAFSGVINIVPRTRQDYTARFIQKIGSYRTGDWNLQGHVSPFNNVYINAGLKKAVEKRRLNDGSGFLENRKTAYSGSIVYDVTPADRSDHTQRLSLSFSDGANTYENKVFVESIKDRNRLWAAALNSWSPVYHYIDAYASYQNLRNSQRLTGRNGALDRAYDTQRLGFTLHHRYLLKKLTLLSGYQFEHTTLDLREKRDGLDRYPDGVESAQLLQQRHGVVGIARFHPPVGTGMIQQSRVDFSYRYDWVFNRQDALDYRPGVSGDGDELNHLWQAGTLKFSTALDGQWHALGFSFYMNAGSNVKFPTVAHQISKPAPIDPDHPEITARLRPEKNRSLELGAWIKKEMPAGFILDDWQLEWAHFRNFYENKFRVYYLPETPVAFYENVSDADISGTELEWKMTFRDRVAHLALGVAYYDVSDPAAFPFKSGLNATLKFQWLLAGARIQLNAFYKGERLAWLRDIRRDLITLSLPAYKNLDVHISRWFEWHAWRVFASFSARNLLNTNTVLEGIAIRDRRLYLGFGVEY